ncbi:MAG: hypothetical protein ACUVX9_12425 [Anaerolineae bacterium]
MSRVVNTDGVGTRRQRLRRTIAEALRHLMAKGELDNEARDLAALIVFCLREIDEGIEQTTAAWEKRDYYLKADRFRQEWLWVAPAADELEKLIRQGAWDRLPASLAKLLGHFGDITVNRTVRSEKLWQGCYQKLVSGQ